MLTFRNLHACFAMVFLGVPSPSYCNPTKQSPKSKSAPVDISSRVDEWVWDAGMFARDKSIEDLRKIAPVLRESKSKRVDQGQEGKHTVSIRTLHFDGLEITGIMNGETFILDSIEISSPKWKVPNGLNVGAPGMLVPPVFGLPARELKAPRELFSGLACSVSFTTNAGRISKVSYAFFYD